VAALSYLLDTNIILELLLNQERADAVQSFLDSVPTDRLFISDFSFHSLGVILFRHRRAEIFMRAVLGDLLAHGVGLLTLAPPDYALLQASAEQFALDFDDAYQYTIARKHDLKLVSFDRDFLRSDIMPLQPT
jgi:predicted nucleic acid-binding protein